MKIELKVAQLVGPKFSDFRPALGKTYLGPSAYLPQFADYIRRPD